MIVVLVVVVVVGMVVILQYSSHQFLHELLIRLSVQCGQFYQLHQLLQVSLV